jgi:CrcB protein
MVAAFYVALGGALGSVCRYGLMQAVTRFAPAAVFPYGTLAVNVLGSLLMGVWVGLMAALLPEKARELHWLFTVGVLGGFTTFSTFSLDIYTLMQHGLYGQMALYIGVSVAASVLAMLCGLWCVRMVAL